MSVCQRQDVGKFYLPVDQTTPSTHWKKFTHPQTRLSPRYEHSFKKYADNRTLSSNETDLHSIDSMQYSVKAKSGPPSVSLQKARNSSTEALAYKHIDISNMESSSQVDARNISDMMLSRTSVGIESNLTSSLTDSTDQQTHSNVSHMTSDDSLRNGDEQTGQQSACDTDMSMPDMAQVMRRFGIDWAPNMVQRMEKAEERLSSDDSTSQGS